MACWSTKATVSLKRVKVTFPLYTVRTVPSATPCGLFPNFGVRNPHPKLQSLLSQERAKLYTDFKFGPYIYRVHPIKNFGDKEAWAYPGTVQSFEVPQLSEERVIRTSNFVHAHSINRHKNPLKISG